MLSEETEVFCHSFSNYGPTSTATIICCVDITQEVVSKPRSSAGAGGSRGFSGTTSWDLAPQADSWLKL